MEVEGSRNIHVADAVDICHEKVFVLLYIRDDAFDTASDHRLLAGVDERNGPGFGLALMDLGRIILQVDGDVRGMEEVIGEVFLDHVSLVAQANDKVSNTMAGVDLHDMP